MLVLAGAVVLLFVVYALWGTDLTTAAHQRALRRQFDRELTAAGRPANGSLPAGSVPRAGAADSGAVADPDPAVPDGQPIGVLDIPAIGLDDVVVQGTAAGDLELGPGHYDGTSMPGNPGNTAIAGHRTTFLHPFYDLNELVPGDPIYVTTLQGLFRYDVVRTLVVAPTDVSVLAPTAAPTLTLTTCNPRYSAATRLVVQALLVSSATRPVGTGADGTGRTARPIR